MKTMMLSGAAALAMTFGAMAAHAGGAVGGPVQPVCYDEDTGDEIDCPTPGTGGTGGTGTGTGGAGTGTGTGTGGTGTGTGGTGTGSGTGSGTATTAVNTPATIGFNSIGQTLSTYIEGDYVVKLLTGSIVGGFGAYGTRGLDTLGPGAAAYVDGSPTPQFTLERTDGGFFSVNSFYNVRLIDFGSNTTTLQGYINGVLSGTSSVTSTFDGFGYPQLSGLAGSYNKVVFTLLSTSSGMSFDLLTVTSAADPTAVPEPASWAMMVAGFGLIGGALRSRRKAAVRFG